jgi:Fe-S cluster assembly iron-binding protein IscA
MATESHSIMVADAARVKIALLIAEEQDAAAVHLRVSVVGGGCSGFEYRFALEPAARGGDYVMEYSVPKLDIAELANLSSWQNGWSDWLHETTPDGIDAQVMFSVFEHYGRNALPKIINNKSVAALPALTAKVCLALYRHSVAFCTQRMATVVPHITIMIDPMSFIYLQGAHLDYVQDGHGPRFIVDNPNAQTTCGCGASFAMAEPQAEAQDNHGDQPNQQEE